MTEMDSCALKPIRIIALTERGHILSKRLQACLIRNETGNDNAVTIWHKPKPFAQRVQQAFEAGERLICICAAGIVVRTLASVIKDKQSDPPVLVLDELGQFVIPLLSGHEGGANQWGQEIAQALNAQLVLTTAQSYVASEPNLQPIYSVGMGCERGCQEAELHQLLQDCLQQAGLTIADIDSINSIDIKSDEVGLMALAHTLEKPFHTWSALQLRPLENRLYSKSEYVFNTVGVYGVAESAAMIAADQRCGRESQLIVTKQKTAKATCAIAKG